MRDTDRTDIIPGLRPSDTPPMGLPVPEGRHRARRGAHIPRPALVAVFGAPIAVIAFLVARFVLAGLLFAGEPANPVGVSPSPTTEEPSFSAEPAAPPPVPTRSRADRSRPRSTQPAAATPTAPKQERSSTRTPAPAASSPRLPSPPASPSPTRTGPSSTPTPTHTASPTPTPEVTG